MDKRLEMFWNGRRLRVWAADDAGRIVPEAELRALVGEVSSDGLLASVGERVEDWPPMVEPPWPRGSALEFGPAEAVDLLSGLSDDRSCGGESVRYWRMLAEVVVSRLSAGRFVPTVQQMEGGWRAVWRLLLNSPAELAWLERIVATGSGLGAAAQPSADSGVRQSATDISEPAAPAPLPRGHGSWGGGHVDAAEDIRGRLSRMGHLVESFLASTADALIRRDLENDPFFERIHTQAAEPFAPPEARWLSALAGADSVIHGDSEQVEAVAQAAAAWVSRVESPGTGQMRVGFVLHEPEAVGSEEPVLPAADRQPPARPWRVTFRLDLVDPGESIEASELFGVPPAAPVSERRGGGSPMGGGGQLPAGGVLGRAVEQRRAALLAGLRAAVELFPPLERVVNVLNEAETRGEGDTTDASSGPFALDLTAVEAHALMRHWSGPLREAGYAVELPNWAGTARRSVGLRLLIRPTEVDGEGVPGPALSDEETDRSGRPGEPSPASSALGVQSLLEFEWEVAVGEMSLGVEHFRELVSRGEPLVRIGGQWVEVDVEPSRRALELLETRPRGRTTLAGALRQAYGAELLRSELPVVDVRGMSWVADLLDETSPLRMGTFAQPAAFRGALRPYQLRGVRWLAFMARLGLGGCLADDMGLGKTIQLIGLLLHEREAVGSGQLAVGSEEGEESREADDGSDEAPKSRSAEVTKRRRGGELWPFVAPSPPGPTLLFAPMSVVGNWGREIERFAPSLRVLVHHGPERLAEAAFVEAAQRHDVVITTYALAHRDLDRLRRVRWWRIVLDEAQKVKNPSAAATLAIRSLQAPQQVALTGTPVENHLSELWSIMEMLNPGLLGPAGEFREQFAVPIEKLGDRERAGRLRRLVRPFILRRTKHDPAVIDDLPEKMEMRVFCNLTLEQARTYERITDQMLGRIDAAAGIQRRGLILAALTRLKQICDHPVLLERHEAGRSDEATERRSDEGVLNGRSGKCERLVEMLEEVIEEGEAALVFTQYRQMGHLLERLIAGRLRTAVQFLHGGMTAKQREAMIARFQDPAGGVRVFLVSLRAGGLGLNLTAANHVFHFDRWWNPAVEAQATDRVYRIGQTRRVQVHKFVCVGTVEERIDRLLTEKLALAERIVGSGDEWLTNLSTDKLREYLSLSKEAVAEF